MRRRHNGGKRHHQPSHYKKKVTTPTTGIYSGAICFSDNFLHQESPQQRSPPTRISSPFTAIVHLLAAAFNELLRSCSGFDLKVSHRRSSTLLLRLSPRRRKQHCCCFSELRQISSLL
ncbi:uncharacterized protein DS421_16g526720 [Arachis hypogaea]|nr:uncharacterized protein DS421_16g526720 [Arachis hypogaea]